MPRRNKQPPQQPGKGGAGQQHPFGALAGLRLNGSKPAGSARPARSEDKRHAQAAEATAGEDDTALFRKTLRDVTPLRDDGRKEVDRPRPAPVLRPRPPEPELPDLAPRRPSDPLADAYADVIPLRNTNRVALGPAAARNLYHAASPDNATDRHGLPRDPGEHASHVILPPDAEQAEPGALFRQMMRGAQPIDQRNRIELARPQPAPAPLKREADERSALDESLLAPLTFEDRLDMGDEAAFLRPGLPRRVLSDLRRGRWTLQGEIDLHGHTREEARDALAQFLAASLQQGRRCIRVIHGKGLGSPGKVSILKQLSRGWLAQREEILAFCQAGPHDGGSGALLVLMRAPNATRR